MKPRDGVLLGGWVLFLSGCVQGSGGGVLSDGDGADDAGYSESSVGPQPDPGSTSLPPNGTDGGDTGAESTSGSGDTGSTSAGTGTTGDAPPLSVCDPQPEGAPFWLALDYDEDVPFLEQTVELDAACVVTTLVTVGDLISMELDCGNAIHTLDVADLGPIDLAVGEQVVLRAHDSQPWWRQTHVMLLRDGVVIVAGMKAESLPSGDGGSYSPASTFFEPLGVAVEQGVCEPEPVPEEEVGCDFLCSPPCTQDERQALRFTSAKQEELVYDGGLGSVDGLALSVAVAETHVQVFCTDTPGSWYELLAVRTR